MVPPGPVSLWSSVPLLCGSLSPSLAQISLLCLSCECRVNLFMCLFWVTVNPSTCLSARVTCPWTVGHVVFRCHVHLLASLTLGSSVSLSVSLSLGCQDRTCLSPWIPGLLFVCPSGCFSVLLPVGPSVFGLSVAWSICWSVAQLVAPVTASFPPPSLPAPLSRLQGSLSVWCLSHPRRLHLSISAFPECVLSLSTPLTALGQKHSSFQRLPAPAPSRNSSAAQPALWSSVWVRCRLREGLPGKADGKEQEHWTN